MYISVPPIILPCIKRPEVPDFLLTERYFKLCGLRLTKRLRKIIVHAIIKQVVVFKITWLRSGDHNATYTAIYLAASGMRRAAYPARRLAVRPALYMKGFSLGDEDGFLKTTDIRCFAVRDKQTYSNTFACLRELCDAL